jgi:hypothetical protein
VRPHLDRSAPGTLVVRDARADPIHLAGARLAGPPPPANWAVSIDLRAAVLLVRAVRSPEGINVGTMPGPLPRKLIDGTDAQGHCASVGVPLSDGDGVR